MDCAAARRDSDNLRQVSVSVLEQAEGNPETCRARQAEAQAQQRMSDQGATPPKARLLTPAEVAACLEVPERSVRRGSLRRLLPWLKIGRRLRMHPDSLQECLRGDLFAASQGLAPLRDRRAAGNGRGVPDDPGHPGRRRRRATAEREAHPYGRSLDLPRSRR